ncbi:hypothetical protein AgCh_030930 [Apium graveolens]
MLLDEMQNKTSRGRNEEFSLNLQLIMDECKTFFFAGHDTTALLLTWTVMLLASNPSWQDKARAEIKQEAEKIYPLAHKGMNCLKVIAQKESSMLGNSSVLPGSTWRSLSMGERGPLASPDLRDLPSDGQSRTSYFGWQQPYKDLTNDSESIPKWKFGDEPIIKRQLSAVLDREQEHRNLSQPPPENWSSFTKIISVKHKGLFSVLILE